ncbi:MAG: dihydropyrimidinase [Acidimicrobiales bacterium]
MLIRNGTVIDAAGTRAADLRAGPGGRVAEIAAHLEPAAGEEVHDASGKLVIPGGVDAHTHLQMTVGRLRVSDDFFTGTRAAAVGGTTTVLDYVPVQRGEDPLAAAARWRSVAEIAAIDWGFHLSLPEPVEEAVIEAAVAAGISSFKLYLAYPDRLQVDDATVLRLMGYARRHGALVALHCENGVGIEELRREALAAGRTGVPEHAATRPAVLEAEAVTRACALAEVSGAQIFVVHLSSAAALTALRAGRARGVKVRAETCPQYLYLDAGRLAGVDGIDFVCAPPLRDTDDAVALWEGLSSGEIDTLGTDHCPFWKTDRRAGINRREGGVLDFTEIPGGLPGVETRLALCFEAVNDGRLGLEDWVRVCSEAPARIFGLWPAKGSLMVGADADVVVFDPLRRQSLAAAALHMATDHSPYEDRTVTGWPELVLSRGRVVAKDGSFTGEEGWGRYIERSPVQY